MSNCDFVAGRSLIDLVASRLALRAPALRAASALTRENQSAQWLSSGRPNMPTVKMVGPLNVITNHGVERGDDLAHDRNDRNFRQLAGGLETFAERFEHRIPIACAHRRHVEHLTDGRTTAPDATPAFELAALEGIGHDADEGRDLFAAHGAELDQIRAAAAELVRLAPDVIFTPSGVTFEAVQQETRTIPIVFQAGDPAAVGQVKDIAHPEGNATGFAFSFGSLGGKWLELLKEAAPNVTRVAFFVRGGLDSTVASVEAAARALRVQLFTIPVSDVADIRAAIESFAAEPNGGLILGRGLPLELQREFPRLAEQYRLPSITGAPRAPIGH